MSQHHHDHPAPDGPAAGVAGQRRHADVAVIGGSAAGLAAALQLGRQRRSVIVIDAGEPRNAPAEHMHSFLGREATPPGDLLRDGRDEVRSYGGEVLRGRVDQVVRADDGRFRVELEGGHQVLARRVVVATGLVDELPAIEGLAAHWGRDVIHCPFCHGYEVRDQRVVQIVTHPRGVQVAGLFRQLTASLTVVVHDRDGIDEGALDRLRAGGVQVVVGPVARVVAGPDGRVSGVELADDSLLAADAVAVGPRFSVNLAPLAPLGLTAAPHPSGLGDHLPVDDLGATAVPGVYAAGNVVDPSQQVLAAAADGSRVAGSVCFDLADGDLRDTTRPSANQADWDQRYGGGQMWSGNPNGTLVAEVEGLAPGRALDVGAGEGGDAVWLAERGWQVTATDISTEALARVAGEADRRNLTVACVHADANNVEPFGPHAFDLVSAMYASIPRTPDGRGVRNLLDAVAEGGTLLVVSHDLEPMRAAAHGRPFDPDAYVRVEDVAAALDDDPHWRVDVHETRPRPPGSATDAHHVDDVVLRAVRLSTS